MTKSPTLTWLEHLRRRFSPSLLRLGADGARALPGGGNSGVLALVGRELCLFLHVDASKVPAKQRPGYVALMVRRAAPFTDPEHDILWLQGRAAVWYWSRERIKALAGTATDIRFRAESVFRGDVPDADAEQLLELDVVPVAGDAYNAGVEARVWRAGQLRACRWWPAVPDLGTWQAFARSAGLEANRPVPDLLVGPLRRAPLIGNQQNLALVGRLDAHIPTLVGATAMLVVALLAWQAAGIARAAWEAKHVEQQIDRLSAKSEAIIRAREQTDAAQSRIDTLLGLRTAASETRLLGEVKRLTPGNWQLASWTLTNGEVLEVTMKTDNPDAAALVAAWEASPLLESVAPATSNTPDGLALQARVTPLREQAP